MSENRPCPECSGQGVTSKIGNRRAQCKTCNAFARRVERAVNNEIRRTLDPSVLLAVQREAEHELYNKLIEE